MAVEPKTRGISGWLLAIVIGRRPDRTLIRLGVLLGLALVAFLVFSFVLYPVQITGPSMYPTYRNGQINFINRLAYLNHEPQRGDVVGIRFSGNHVMYVKRIVGMPGESIAFSRGTIYINGKPLDEPYLKFPSKDWESLPKQLGSNEYYVVGDNRSMPFEYHEKGAAPRQRIIGKILLPSTS
jgi:signal peptidase I